MDTLKTEPATFFAALADPTRFRLVGLLARQPEGAALCVNALAACLEISQPAVSQHLQVLRSVGLVHAVRKGQRVHYHLDRERLLVGQAFLRELATTMIEGGTRTFERGAGSPDPCVDSESHS
jgi:DNA-binding transcriptional ArsR family regulator